MKPFTTILFSLSQSTTKVSMKFLNYEKGKGSGIIIKITWSVLMLWTLRIKILRLVLINARINSPFHTQHKQALLHPNSV